MKTIYKTGIIAAVALIFSANSSSAQENESGESVRKQYVNNNVPGAKYGPEKKSGKEETEKPKTYNKGDFKSTLDEGKSQSGGAAARRTVQKSARSAAPGPQKPLPSDQPAVKEEVKKIDPPKPPSQGDEKKTN